MKQTQLMHIPSSLDFASQLVLPFTRRRYSTQFIECLDLDSIPYPTFFERVFYLNRWVEISFSGNVDYTKVSNNRFTFRDTTGSFEATVDDQFSNLMQGKTRLRRPTFWYWHESKQLELHSMQEVKASHRVYQISF